MLIIKNLHSSLFGPIDLEVAAGECVAVTGPSGAGKSLFLRAIADLDPNRGNVTLSGEARADIPANRWRRRVALVPAESGWWADRVGEHFTPDDEDPALTAGLVAALGLDSGVMQWPVDRLSSGERHRLAIIRALVLKPDAILLDEPTASLDAASTEAVESLVRQRLAGGAAIIVVTHDAAQADRLGARPVRILNGLLSAAGETAP